MWEMENFGFNNLKDKEDLRDIVAYRRIILK
jgi:hypothetical protein